MAEVRVTVPVGAAELASDLLWGLGATGIAEREGQPGAVEVMLTAGFVDRQTAVRAVEALDSCWAPVLDEVVDDSWLDAWRPYARPVRAGARFVLVPTWQPDFPAAAGDVVVRLDPGRQFGSGSHPSTRLVLAAVERMVTTGTSVLDVGCGSGVLAVASALLGARPVVAVDVDRAAPAVTAANAAANGVGHLVEPSTTPVTDVDGHFSVVLANLLAPIVVELAEALTAKVAPGGSLVVGGLLADRWRATVAHLAGWTAVAVDREEGWAAITLQRLTSTSTGQPPAVLSITNSSTVLS